MAQTVILAEQTHSFSWVESFGVYGTLATNKAELVVGEIYSVIWDNETYICTAQDASVFSEGTVFLGNASLFGLGGNNEPFVIASRPEGDFSDIISLTDTEAGCTHTVAIYQAESGSSDEIVLKYFTNEEKKFSGVEIVELNTSDGGTQLFSKGEAVENVPIALDFSEGDQTVNAPDGTLVKSAIIQKPSNLIPENIKKGENVAGVDGEFVGNSEDITVSLDFSEGDQIVTAEEDKLIKSVVIQKPSNLIPSNIKEGESIAGVLGTHAGSGGLTKKTVNFYDYDGTLLYSCTKSEALALTELPELPTHDELGQAVKWNWTLAEIKSELSTRYWIDVGAEYLFDATKIFVELTTAAVQVTYKAYATSTPSASYLSIDWGDGSSISKIAVSKGSSNSISHTYETSGEYVITITSDRSSTKGHQSGGVTFSDTSSFVRKVWLGKQDYGGTGAKTVYEYIMSSESPSQTAGTSEFTYKNNLGFFVVPSDFDFISNAYFRECYSLRGFSVPREYILSNSYTHYCNYCLEYAYINLTTVSNYLLYKCYSLKVLQFAEGVTSISGTYSCAQCYSLEVVIFPSTLTTMNVTFAESKKAKFYVPDDMVETFKAKTSMAAHINRIFPISQLPETLF